MEDLTAQVAKLHVLVSAARAMDALAEVYARLIDLAALMLQNDRKTEAAPLLAYIMHQPDVPYDEYDRADELWMMLEAELDADVLTVAKTDATFMTLRGIVEQAFGLFLPPPDEEVPSKEK